MNETEKEQKIVDYINDMNEDEMVELHNRYCKAAGYKDNRIYSMGELDEVLDGRTPTDILQRALYGSFSPSDAFFWFDDYANLGSASWAFALPICAEDIADYILLKEDSLGDDKIQEILDGEDKDDDEKNNIR